MGQVNSSWNRLRQLATGIVRKGQIRIGQENRSSHLCRKCQIKLDKSSQFATGQVKLKQIKSNHNRSSEHK